MSCGGVCDGEGYSITVFECRTCGQEIEPRTQPDYSAMNPGLVTCVINHYTLHVLLPQDEAWLPDSIKDATLALRVPQPVTSGPKETDAPPTRHVMKMPELFPTSDMTFEDGHLVRKLVGTAYLDPPPHRGDWSKLQP